MTTPTPRSIQRLVADLGVIADEFDAHLTAMGVQFAHWPDPRMAYPEGLDETVAQLRNLLDRLITCGEELQQNARHRQLFLELDARSRADEIRKIQEECAKLNPVPRPGRRPDLVSGTERGVQARNPK